MISVKRKIKDSSLSEENNSKNISDGDARVRPCKGMGGMTALYRKEMSDHIRSKRFLTMLGLILLISYASIYGALTSLPDAIASDASCIFLRLFTLSGSSTPSLTSFIVLLGLFVGLNLGFDATNSEHSEGALNRPVAQPAYRDAVIDGKSLAGATVILIMVFSTRLIAGAVGLLATGVPPAAEEARWVLVLLFLISVYVCFRLALSILCSMLCHYAATSAMIVIALWIFFALFTTLMVSIVANALYPMGQTVSAGQILDNYNCQMSLNRLSPYYLYSEAVSTIMNLMVCSISIVLSQQLSGTITGRLSLRQSRLLVWPHLTGLLALTAVVFAASYISFMKRGIRSR